MDEEQTKESVEKLPAREKSKLLTNPCQNPQAGSSSGGGGILEKVDKPPLGQGAPKERFCVEQQLVSRLKWMAGILILCSLCALAYAIFLEDSIAIAPEQELLAIEEEVIPEVLNYFVVAAIFATVGISCFLFAWKKQKQC